MELSSSDLLGDPARIRGTTCLTGREKQERELVLDGEREAFRLEVGAELELPGELRGAVRVDEHPPLQERVRASGETQGASTALLDELEAHLRKLLGEAHRDSSLDTRSMFPNSL